MKAALYNSYGGPEVVSIGEIARPEIAEDEVLVKVYATTVSAPDWRFRASAYPHWYMTIIGRLMTGVTRPKAPVLGREFAGRVVAVGKAVTRFKLGDEVFGSGSRTGAHAEYLAIGEADAIVHKPAALGYDEAAAIPFGALAALVFLRDFGKLEPGQNIAIVGASGAVGSYAVQLAKHMGATVTAVVSTRNVKLLETLGADKVVDYTKQDFSRSGERYDLIMDTVGATSFADVERALKSQGTYLPVEFGVREAIQSMGNKRRGKKVVIGISGDSREDLEYVARLAERGAIRPVIDSRHAFAAIRAAHARVDSRRKTGAVVVTVDTKVEVLAAA